MKNGRYGHACELWKGELIVMGGDGAKTSVEIFSISTKQWRTGPTLTSKFAWGQTIIFQSTLYLVNREGQVVKLTDEQNWQNAVNIGNIGSREVFPAPIVSPAMIGC